MGQDTFPDVQVSSKWNLGIRASNGRYTARGTSCKASRVLPTPCTVTPWMNATRRRGNHKKGSAAILTKTNICVCFVSCIILINSAVLTYPKLPKCNGCNGRYRHVLNPYGQRCKKRREKLKKNQLKKHACFSKLIQHNLPKKNGLYGYTQANGHFCKVPK